ncbi:hypothetical protein [Arsenicibacter rosenii]|uniref:hypothetical protein n=1 Tax=Arsenicibacter rosenii TaxID=1750698 RepID=UPI0008F964FF|nr:hypothetical protein [Arsenicibacter rosenii]
MQTILVITDQEQETKAELKGSLLKMNPLASILFRRFDAGLMDELMTGSLQTVPYLIFISSCMEGLSMLKELKASPMLSRIPVLMLQAGATRRKARFDQILQA